MPVHTVLYEDEFLHMISTNSKVVVYFTGKWCGICKGIYPFFEEMSDTYLKVCFVKIDINEYKGPQIDEIKSIPTFHRYKN